MLYQLLYMCIAKYSFVTYIFQKTKEILELTSSNNLPNLLGYAAINQFRESVFF